MANGVIENSIPANEFRTRIPDKMVLKNGDADNSVAKHKIFITDGNIDTVNNNKFVPRIVGKNIIDAVNAASADGKTVANATEAQHADSATNVVLATTKNSDGSTTIKAGTGSATIENCINAKVADFANRGKLSIDNDSTNGDQIWIGNPPATNAVNINNARNARYALYASSDETKGTIEERLTNLGFKTAGTANRKSSFTTYVNSVTGFMQGTVFALTIETKDPGLQPVASDIELSEIVVNNEMGLKVVKPQNDITFTTSHYSTNGTSNFIYKYKTDGKLYVQVKSGSSTNMNTLIRTFVLYLRNSNSDTQFILSD